MMSRAHVEGRTFYSFPDAAPWEDDWLNDVMPWSWLTLELERAVTVSVPLRTRAEIQREHATEGSAR